MQWMRCSPRLWGMGRGLTVLDEKMSVHVAVASLISALRLAGRFCSTSASPGPTILHPGPAHCSRLDRFLAEQRPGVPFSFVQKLIRTRKVRVQRSDGAWVREKNAARRLVEGERVCVHSRLFAEGVAPRGGILAEPPARDVQRLRKAILYEDDDCVVINKPSGIAVQGGSKIPRGRHLDEMMSHVVGGDATVRLVHRLDRETSGCLVMAKSRCAAAELAAAFQEGRVEKMYVALVAGHIPRKTGMWPRPCCVQGGCSWSSLVCWERGSVRCLIFPSSRTRKWVLSVDQRGSRMWPRPCRWAWWTRPIGTHWYRCVGADTLVSMCRRRCVGRRRFPSWLVEFHLDGSTEGSTRPGRFYGVFGGDCCFPDGWCFPF